METLKKGASTSKVQYFSECTVLLSTIASKNLMLKKVMSISCLNIFCNSFN